VPIDVTPPGSPGWWLARLIKRLQDRRETYDQLESYINGTAGVPVTATKSVRQSYQRLMHLARTNYAELVVDAVRERLKPIAFRTGADADINGDQEAWRMWQANTLDADSSVLHHTALAMRDAYCIVGGPDDTGFPVITPEDPRQVTVEYDPTRRRSPLAALKLFRVSGADLAYLYLPGFVIRAGRPTERDDEELPGPYPDLHGWEWLDRRAQQLPAPVVPVVGFHNRMGINRESAGEFEPHLPLLDRINFTILNRLEIVTMQAFRQRGIKGVPDVDEAGKPINYDDIFAADPGAMWALPQTAEVWESGQVDLGPIHTSVRDDVQDLAAVTRTPLFYLTPDAANGSAEGASLAREGLVFKVEDRQVEFGESWERVMSLAFTFAGDDTRARRPDMEVVWAPAERFSLAERYDAASKAGAAGVPQRTIWSDVLQFPPQQVERMETERAADAFLNPPQEPALGGGGGGVTVVGG
jgi:hypothetical protein